MLILVMLLSACHIRKPVSDYTYVPREPTEETITVPTGEIVTTAPDYVVAEANRVAAVVQGQQTDTSFSFIAMSDTHISNRYADSILHAGQAAALLRENVEIDFAALLGDIAYGDATTTIDSGLEEITAVNAYLEEAYTGIPNFRTTGNHDPLTYSFELNNDVLDNSELFPLIGAYNTGAVYGSTDGGYCYRDFGENKTRVILLNTSDMDGITVTENTDRIGISGAQAMWFAQALDLSDKADAADWGILILSHIPLDFGELLPSAGKILDAYVNGGFTSFTWQEQAVSYDYSGKNEAEIIANIHGHNHCFLVDFMHLCNQSGNQYPSTIKRICIPNACLGRENERGTNGTPDSNQIEFGEEITYDKTPDSATDTAFNIVTVDRENGKIYCANYGAGYDREISYRSEASVPEGSFTNLIPIAQAIGDEADSGILDGVGFRNGAYLSTGSNMYGADPDCVAVGAIEYAVPKTGLPGALYIWGTTITEDSHIRFFMLDQTRTKIAVYATGADISKFFTIESLGEQYYKLTPVESGKRSLLSAAAKSNIENGY